MCRLDLTLRRVLAMAGLALAATAIGAVFGAVGAGSAANGTPPVNVQSPTIGGMPQVGKTLIAYHGLWRGSTPMTFAYLWLRCPAKGGPCDSVSGATGRLYDLLVQDAGSRLRVRVTARNSAGSASVTSAATAVIAPVPPVTGCPPGTGPIDVQNIASPARLIIDGWNSSPSVIGRNPGSVTVSVHVSACGGRPVSGALVYLTAVPWDQLSVPPEAATSTSGWATEIMQEAARYPASPRQELLALFVRARKPGEPILGGVSNRRLVSLPVDLRR